MKFTAVSSSLLGRSLAVAVLLLAAMPYAGAQREKLTQPQIRHLIQIHAPDDLVARQIQARGLDFAVTNAELTSFAAEGAGSQTLAALRALIQTGALLLRTEPGAEVSVDGRDAGASNAAGLLLLKDMPPGAHTLVVTKQGFHEDRQSFTLTDREALQLSAPLAWAGGLLTISAQPADATILVIGPASFIGAQNAARCPPGTYSATVSLSGYFSQKRTFTVAVDQNHEESFQLVVDPAVFAKTLADARSSLSAGDTEAAIRLSRQALALNPTSAEAYKVLAEASFANGDFQTFIQDAGRAIRGGQSVAIPLMHVHNFPRQLVHQVDMTISGSQLNFANASGVKCKIPESLNYQILAKPSVIRDDSGTLVLHLVWPVHPEGFGNSHEWDLVPLGSGMVRQQLPQGTIAIAERPSMKEDSQSCPN
jgi:tetratricopeptide (TPR) repeat protein